jgi:very-short-patch-repair endonuclease
MSSPGEVLVAIIKTWADMDIARDHHWYRIPVKQVEKLKRRQQWPPKWLAFYQPKVFKEEAYAVNYYAQVIAIQEMARWELFPDEPKNSASDRRYCKLEISPLMRLPQPIVSKRLRRIPFIPTTWGKFIQAQEINDLWDESPLEDLLWDELKQRKIDAERQEHVKVKENHYMLDFAIYCVDGKINVETDGDTFHTEKDQVAQDNVRENALKTEGWRTLRFNTQQVKEQMAKYCVPTILENIQSLGGLESRSQSQRGQKTKPVDPIPNGSIGGSGDRNPHPAVSPQLKSPQLKPIGSKQAPLEQTQQLCLLFENWTEQTTPHKRQTKAKRQKAKKVSRPNNLAQQLNLFNL